MKEALPKICTTSSDPKKGGCNCIDCIYNIDHYEPKPDDWFITQKSILVTKGECLQMKGD